MAQRTLSVKVPVERISPVLNNLPRLLPHFTMFVGASWRDTGEVLIRVDDAGDTDVRIRETVDRIVNDPNCT
jgi:hypothetical protein